MNPQPAEIGDPISDTPALIVDLDAVDRKIARMAEWYVGVPSGRVEALWALTARGAIA